MGSKQILMQAYRETKILDKVKGLSGEVRIICQWYRWEDLGEKTFSAIGFKILLF
jgi:hypothetical protein